MPVVWTPEPIWEGQDAYVIGGGPSLQGFDWNLIRGKNTIGCNTAYILGPEIVKFVLFSDYGFYDKNKEALERFPNPVVTQCRSFLRNGPSWLQVMSRKNRGLGKGSELGMNYNTGASAINLALSLGAQRVFLLGIDLKGGKFRTHWHNQSDPKWRSGIYGRFSQGFSYVARDLPLVFPGREVFSVSDDTTLRTFPVIPMAEHFRSVRDVVVQGSAGAGRETSGVLAGCESYSGGAGN